MNKRCIVNVATGELYVSQQKRLIDSFAPHIANMRQGHSKVMGYTPKQGGIDLLVWQNIFPEGSQLHEWSPYGFKIHAIKMAAEKWDCPVVLWIDSPGFAIADPSPIFEKIEKHGYYAMSHHDPLENWVGDTALKRFGMTREQLKGFHLPSGSCYGFDLSQAWVRRLFDQFFQLEEEGLFKSEVIGPDKWHRHDEAILALLLMQFNLPVFFNDPLFQSDSPECVIRSGANWTQDAKVYGV